MTSQLCQHCSLTARLGRKKLPTKWFQLIWSVQWSYFKYRQRFWQLWRDLPLAHPQPLIPLAYASINSQLTYSWMTNLMILGYRRTLQASDLYKLYLLRQAGPLAEKLEDRGEIHPSILKRSMWAIRAIPSERGSRKCTYAEHRAGLEQGRRVVGRRKHPSFVWALKDVFGQTFWVSGVFWVCQFRCVGFWIIIKDLRAGGWRCGPDNGAARPQSCYIICQCSAAHLAGEPLPNVSRGFGVALGLWSLTIVTSLCANQYYWYSMETGVLTRAVLIACIFERGVMLTGKERAKLTNATLVSRVDTFWAVPIQAAIRLIILLVELGPSALAGFSVFVLIVPFQRRLMALQHRIRHRSVVWTEHRTKVLVEALGAMRVIKFFSYEVPYLNSEIVCLRKELHEVCKLQFLTSASFALGTSLPVLGTTLAFITYTLTSHNFNAAVIFSSLSLFQLLRQPMMYMPRALIAISDGASAIGRLSDIFRAELITGKTMIIDKFQEEAILILEATFEWESEKIDRRAPDIGRRGGDYGSLRGGVDLAVPRGHLVAIVGPVGSGKSSLLQGIIGEMRKVSGHVSVGGKVAYCSQTAWIQNTTLGENVLFEQPFNEERYWRVIELSCLLPDLELLPDGDLTEIGERGINLSGGQKRVNIARALYFNPEIVIFDDPLSAVPFEDTILGFLRSRGITALLVTHAIHFLSQVDYIYTMRDGMIVERGTFNELVELAQVYGGQTEGAKDASEADEAALKRKNVTIEDVKLKSANVRERAEGKGKAESRLIVKEQCKTGSVSLQVYWAYLVAGRGAVMLPLIIVFICVMQASQIMNTYALVWWESDTWDRRDSFYQLLYGCFGIGQALFAFILCVFLVYPWLFLNDTMVLTAVRARLYGLSCLPEPTSALFNDVSQPLGRILGVFGKDVDTMDNQLVLCLTVSSVVGAVDITSVLEPYFLIAVIVLYLGYSRFVGFCRASAREVKRLDSMLRSLLYAHFSETFTGLPTIRSYGNMKRFVGANRYYIDLEGRYVYAVIGNQRWLAVRLEFMGAILALLITLLAVTDVSSINAAQIDVALTYTKEAVPQEASHEKPDVKLPVDWPHEGSIEFKDVQMNCRPGLPDVLQGISFSTRGGEKIGITGAGKSSLMLALYRIVELSGGSIILDGYDWNCLEREAALGHPYIYSWCTIRSDLDPFIQYDDAKLRDELYRSCLVDPPSVKDEHDNETRTSRYTLETVIDLVSALVKDCKVVVLDEATASVDLETDSKIHRTITTEFRGRALLCIAHRLRTIISHDRVLVMDAGVLAEFDTPYNLYQKEGGLFRGMCDRSHITLKDIETSRCESTDCQ
ncbi:ABC protein [Pisolithus marmoratus]|nr:ABC protein [Pisolithus marmoratus]